MRFLTRLRGTALMGKRWRGNRAGVSAVGMGENKI